MSPREAVSRRAARVPEPGILAIMNLTRQLPDVIHLEVGDTDLDTPAPIVEAMIAALQAGYTHYAPMAGLPELRRAVAEKVARENGLSVDPETQVLITPGATTAIFLALQSLVDPGDEVLVPDPCWPPYRSMIRMAGGTPIFYPLTPDTFQLDVDAIARRVTPETKVVMINSPANPTGAVFERERLAALARLAAERDLYLISDEAYEHMVYDGKKHHSLASLPVAAERTVTVFSFSKSYAMTGWRLGYAVGPAPLIHMMLQLLRYTTSCINTAIQRAGVIALNLDRAYFNQVVQEYQARRDFLWQELNHLRGFRCRRSEGGFFLFPDVSELGEPSAALAERLLRETGVAMVPGSAFGPRGEGHLRIRFTLPLPELEEAVHRLQEVIGTKD